MDYRKEGYVQLRTWLLDDVISRERFKIIKMMRSYWKSGALRMKKIHLLRDLPAGPAENRQGILKYVNILLP